MPDAEVQEEILQLPLIEKRRLTYLKNLNDKKTGDWFFKKYKDKDEANKKWEEWKNQPKKYSYEWFLYRTNNNEEESQKRYNSYLNKIQKNKEKHKSEKYYLEKYGEDWENVLRNKYKIGKASKESLKLFIPLYKILRKNYRYNIYDILFGIKGLKEFFLYDKKTKTRKLYDFTILSEKIIFEFNGDRKIYKKSIE